MVHLRLGSGGKEESLTSVKESGRAMRFWQEGKDFITFGVKAYGVGARLSLDGFDSR
jgi:hypothetical protein